MNSQPVSPQVRIWQLGLGFSSTAVLHNLVAFGLIEELRDAPKSLFQLAEVSGSNADMLFRTLRFAVAIDVVSQSGDQYALTEVGRMLLKGVPGSFYSAATIIGMPPWQNAWANFSHSLKTGENAFEPVMGAEFFDYLDQNAEYGNPFNEWQTALTTMTAAAICEAYDFTPFETVCDIGGGQGTLLKGILTANSHLRGILYDQENVVKENVLADLSDRVEITPGNFFEHAPSADALIMKNVLHDWSDEKCLTILSRCRESMQPATRLLIVERVISEPVDAVEAFYDLHMQVMMGCKERTENEFRSLFGEAGLKLERIIPTKSPMKILEVSL